MMLSLLDRLMHNINHKKKIYELFKNKITFNSFQSIWQGQSWSHIMPEVFTFENKQYYKYYNSKGSKGAFAILTDDEVLKVRKRYVTETAKEIYKDYSNILKYQTLQQILWGRTYTNVPIYKKKEKIGITLLKI